LQSVYEHNATLLSRTVVIENDLQYVDVLPRWLLASFRRTSRCCFAWLLFCVWRRCCRRCRCRFLERLTRVWIESVKWRHTL